MPASGAWFSRSGPRELVPFNAVLDAVGEDGAMGSYRNEVPLAQVLGSVAKSADFDHRFRPRHRTTRYRAVLDRFRSGEFPPPIEVVRLGQLYFVVDGHHRVAAARELHWTHLPARVRRICTVAYTCRCVKDTDLPGKAAERRFLEEVPLPAEVRRALWLDRPADWSRLTDAALAWGFRRQRDDPRAGGVLNGHVLASVWWNEEVMPTVMRLRDTAPTDLVDIQLYVTELGRRDGLGDLDWPSPHCCPDHTPTVAETATDPRLNG